MGKKDWFDACRNGDISVVSEYIKSFEDKKIKRVGLHIDSLEEGMRNGLHLAAQHNHLTCVDAILIAGANMYVQDESACNALHYAAWNLNVKMCQSLLLYDKKKLLHAAKNTDGQIPLHLAVKCSNTVSVLIDAGSDPLVLDRYGQTSFDLACAAGVSAVVQVFLPHCGQVIRHVQSYTHASPLCEAARAGHTKIVQMLLADKFNANGSASKGTAMHEAALGLRVEVVRLLLQAGADPDRRNHRGETVCQMLEGLKSSEHLRLRESIQKFMSGTDLEKALKCAPPKPSLRKSQSVNLRNDSKGLPPPRPPPPVTSRATLACLRLSEERPQPAPRKSLLMQTPMMEVEIEDTVDNNTVSVSESPETPTDSWAPLILDPSDCASAPGHKPAANSPPISPVTTSLYDVLPVHQLIASDNSTHVEDNTLLAKETEVPTGLLISIDPIEPVYEAPQSINVQPLDNTLLSSPTSHEAVPSVSEDDDNSDLTDKL